MAESLLRLRASANSLLSRYEPLSLIVSTLLALAVASILHSILRSVQENGLKAAFLGFLINSVKLVPGVNKYIDAQKEKVVEKLQSGSKAKRDSWQTELPRVGLGRGVIEKLESEKANDVVWRGRCSGTVYIGGSEYEGHFSLTNEAYSMLIRHG
eukprot:TRINITY_DN10814_c0_g3_i1.p1 TRINITY_DN10814_c0_g3~~TRINITY_DN10814_c0_g3_i1.p1  ORF type:complete len:155 (+),score=21.65 TRINITY_DN10814_c0_g3_i1:211-675(+)